MKFLIVLFIILHLISCKKAEDRRCWKSSGKNSEKTIPLINFDKLEIGTHLPVTLIQDTANFINLTGAENLLNLIETKIEDGRLTILNLNKCNFLRSYKKKDIHVYLHFKNISNIEFDGSEPLDSEGELIINNLTLHVKDGATSINLNLKTQYLFASISKGYTDITFSGSTKYASFKITSNAFCNTNDFLIQDSIDFVSSTVVPCKINVQGAKARIQIEESGNVIYRGTPISLETILYGTGQVQPE